MRKKSWTTLLLCSVLFLGWTTLPITGWLPPREAQADNNYDLSDLYYIKKAVFLLKKNYVDPKMIKPEKMFFLALQRIQLKVPAIRIIPSKDKSSVRVYIANRNQRFLLNKVRTLDDIPYQLRQLFRYINRSYRGDVPLPEVEYSALKGMLSILDRHSAFMTPSYHRDMQISRRRRGSYVGLGITVQLIKGRLTIISPMPGSPAAKAGLKPMDKIVAIGNESTNNMSLRDAVKRMRGKPGTKIVLWIMRKGFVKPKKFIVKRAVIRTKSATGRTLPGKIGYIRIKSFARRTYSEMHEALKDIRKEAKGLNGLILDLRGNPGGYLYQAIKISDSFLEEGEIVTHQGTTSAHQTHKAKKKGTQPFYPIVVLVNRGSASASEIVSGALKNNHRAIVVGQQTYGKGTVQMVYSVWHPNMQREQRTTLKLTIAQYLTPGRISIQGTGVTPDIALHPVELKKEALQIFREDEAKLRKNKKLPSFLKATKEFRKPLFHLPYVHREEKAKGKPSAPTTKSTRKTGKPKKKVVSKDFEIRFAHALLQQTKKWHRKAFFKTALPFLHKSRNQHSQRIHNALKRFGVDWSTTKKPKTTKLKVSYKLLYPKKSTQKQIWAGKNFTLQVSVKNTSQETAYRVRAITHSKFWFLNRKEFVFGRIPGGDTKTWKVQFKLPSWLKPQVHQMDLNMFTDASPKPQVTHIPLHCYGHKQPRFAFSYAIEERKGNKDQLLQAGEEVALRVTVKNLGPGVSAKTAAKLVNKTGWAFFITRSRIKLGSLKPGEKSTGWFRLKVHKRARRGKLKMKLTMFDTESLTYVSKPISIKIYPSSFAIAPSKVKKTLKVTNSWSWLYSGASLDTKPIAKVSKSEILQAVNQLGPFYQVRLPRKALGKRHHAKSKSKKADKYHWYGWIAAHEVTEAKKEKPLAKSTFKFKWQFETPTIQLDAKHQPLLHTKEKYTVKGRVQNNVMLKDMYILVNNEKVYYKKLRYFSKHAFKVPVKLKKGRNRITIIAREAVGFANQLSLTVFRGAKQKP